METLSIISTTVIAIAAIANVTVYFLMWKVMRLQRQDMMMQVKAMEDANNTAIKQLDEMVEERVAASEQVAVMKQQAAAMSNLAEAMNRQYELLKQQWNTTCMPHVVVGLERVSNVLLERVLDADHKKYVPLAKAIMAPYAYTWKCVVTNWLESMLKQVTVIIYDPALQMCRVLPLCSDLLRPGDSMTCFFISEPCSVEKAIEYMYGSYVSVDSTDRRLTGFLFGNMSELARIVVLCRDKSGLPHASRFDFDVTDPKTPPKLMQAFQNPLVS